MKDRFYIKRQTRAGKNYGTWAVHAPSGVRLVPGLTKGEATHVCAAFELARLHPTEGNTIGYERNFAAGSEHMGGKVYVFRAGYGDYVGTKK